MTSEFLIDFENPQGIPPGLNPFVTLRAPPPIPPVSASVVTVSDKTYWDKFLDVIWQLVTVPLSFIMPDYVIGWLRRPILFIMAAYLMFVITTNSILFIYILGVMVVNTVIRLIRTISLANLLLENLKVLFEVVNEAWEQATYVPTPWYMLWYNWVVDVLMNPLIPLLTIASVVVAIKIIKPYLTYELRKMMYKARGFTGEARVPGSEFVRGLPPKSQVEILAISMFSSKVVGYGARFRNALVVPRHVVDNIRGYDIGVRGPNMTHILTEDCIPSIMASDLIYYRFSNEFWSKMGVGVMNSVTVGVRSAARISGPEGISSGWVAKRPEVGMLQYTGSTDFGYSGALYFHGNVVYGMHTGSLDGVNSGYSSELIEMEVNKIVPEISTPDEIDEDFNVAGKSAPSWTSDTLRKKLEKVSKKRPDATYVNEGMVPEPDSNDIVIVKEILDELTPSMRRVLRNVIMSTDPRMMTGHSNEGPEVPVTAETVTDEIYDELDRLKEVTTKMTSALEIMEGAFGALREEVIGKGDQINERTRQAFQIQDETIRNALKEQRNFIENMSIEVANVTKFCLPDRVAKLEAEIKDININLNMNKEKPQEKVVREEEPQRIGCTMCARTFRSKMATIQHIRNAHEMTHEQAVLAYNHLPGFKPEGKKVNFRDNVSKIRTDKKGSFLGQNSIGRRYGRTSASKVEEIRSTSTLESQSKMDDMMKKLDNICDLLQKGMVGHTSEKSQN